MPLENNGQLNKTIHTARIYVAFTPRSSYLVHSLAGGIPGFAFDEPTTGRWLRVSPVIVVEIQGAG